MRNLISVLVLLTATACSSAPAPLGAQDGIPLNQPRTLSVSGTASVSRTPDRAFIDLAVETLAETARSATDRNATAMEAVLRAVREQGIDPSQIRTQRIDLQPRYERPRDGTEPGIVGYRAVNQVRVRVDQLDRLGRVVDAAVSAGANQVTGIEFQLSDQTAAYHDALRDAIARARAEAEAAAAALGETLGPPLQVSTGGMPSRPLFRARAMDMAMEMAEAPPVEPGEIDIQATVQIVWRLGT